MFATEDRSATIATVEAEFAFRYTRVIGEWIRDVIDTTTGDRVASGWYVTGQQTLSPRWFVAGRVERIAAPAVLFGPSNTTTPVVVDQRLQGIEETIGYRLTSDLTLRVSHRARRGFGRPGFDNTFATSLVWWKRWM